METVYFTKPIEFEDREEEIEFTATFSRDGIGAYEIFGRRGYDYGNYNIDEIHFNKKGLSKKDIDFIEQMIDSGDMDSDVWDKFND